MFLLHWAEGFTPCILRGCCSSAFGEEKGVTENTRKALTNIDVSLPCVQIVRAWKHHSAKNRDQTTGGKRYFVVTLSAGTF